MKKLIFTLALMVVISSLSYSQFPHQEWVQSFGTNGGAAVFLAVDQQGASYVAGSVDWSDGPESVFLNKVSQSGNILYTASVDTCSFAAAFKDASNNLFVAGVSMYSSPKKSSIVKFDASGARLWNIYDDFAYNDAIIDLKGDASGNAYVLRYKAGINQIIKYNTSGAQQFIMNIADTIAPASILLDHLSNIIILGNANPGGSSYSIVTIKYSQAGLKQWKSVFVTPVSFQSNPHWKIFESNAGNIYVMACISYLANSIDYGVIKYNSSGQQQWVAHFDLGQYDVAMDMALDASENAYVTGSVGTVKFNSSGIFQWVEPTAGMSAITLDKNGNAFVTGSAAVGNFSGMNSNKINPEGILQWNIVYSNSPPFSAWADAIGLDTSGNVLISGITGSTPMPGYRGGAAVVKYSQLNGITKIGTTVPVHYSLSQNFPNPFNPTTKFKIEIAKSSFTKVTVFDVLGREVATLGNQQLQPGTYEISWDASNYPSGVYFYKITASEFTATKKMIILK